MVRKKNDRCVLIFCCLLPILLQSVIPLQASGEDFTIIVLPDTQNYSSSYPEIFSAQTQWIVDNRSALNIVYVSHVGDIVNTASSTYEWNNADGAMKLLENPVTTGLPGGIPYGIVPGNHDEPTILYSQYFGAERFCNPSLTICRSYYGGGYPYGTNDSSYTLFSASGMDFIVINLEYVNPSPGVLYWANQLLKDNINRRAIIVSHYIINGDASFGSWGQQIFDALKDNPNLFLMLSGHVHTEARRTDAYSGRTAYSLLADYQDEPNGGNGWLRVLNFSPINNSIRIRTYSPWLDQYQTDANSDFMLSYEMDSGASNLPPVAVDDTFSTTVNTFAKINVIANDNDPDDDTLVIDLLTQPANGMAVSNGDGTITYSPNSNFIGADSYTYTITDGKGGYDTATVTIRVYSDFQNEPTGGGSGGSGGGCFITSAANIALQ